MLVQAPAGELPVRWTSELGQRRFDFRHDGSGTVQMLDSAGWIAVETSWIAGPALCWNGLCVPKGISPWIDQLVSNRQLSAQGLV